ncbi:putative methyltransferase-like protein 24 [Saccoglossus kowalevskii]|uniref:Uncharacterized protein LOC100374710 n=1 Tax=Saccoglossus kowalevskii TaxID=10224 RepID=A0ABM0GID3_SACKO|nr:PREDICTED: uncharacterized protein LOC100374710 [Saccoglossus kowalevskii]
MTLFLHRIGFPDHKHADRIWFYSLGLWYEDVDDQVVFNKDNVTAEHWKCRTLETIMEMLGHSKKPIDVLKFDIDNNEHLIFHQLIMSGVLKYVKQLDFGVHLDIIPRERKDLILGVYRYMKTAFDEFGFKLWFSNENTYEAEVQNFGRHAGGRRHNVMEMSWVNTNYLNLE